LILNKNWECFIYSAS